MYSIVLADKFKKQLKKIPKQEQERIGKVIERIKIRPFSHAERIVGSPHFRVRSGDYRIIINIKQKVLIIYVLEVGHRKNIYKK
ncbi:MAG: type II toxin-antitoxin system RelE family toxin [Nanoarchaeota archaeon]